MNPQEQNTAAIAPGIQKDESPKQPVAANAPAEASVKSVEKDAAEGSTTKSSCGTK
jgi:hypothetical protein